MTPARLMPIVASSMPVTIAQSFVQRYGPLTLSASQVFSCGFVEQVYSPDSTTQVFIDLKPASLVRESE